jgi:DNA-binding response OmpR family regulator
VARAGENVKNLRFPADIPREVRILILDDQEPVVSMLARVCTAEGHDVTAFTSSPEALIALATEPYDLLMTDMNMPDPDGMTVIREARRLQPDIFTLVITGHAGHYPLAQIVVAGTADVIFKPFHLNELKARLALTRQRMKLIDEMRAQHQALHSSSRRMISGLEGEIIGLNGKVRRPARIEP